MLLDFTWTRDKDPRIPLGHASILTTLRQNPNIQVLPLVFAVNQPSLSMEQLVSRILHEAQQWPPEQFDVAIGAYVWAEAILQKLLPCLRKRRYRGRIILGGPQISYAPSGLEALYPDADVFIRGYGEHAMLDLIQSEQRQPIAGVHYAGSQDQMRQAQVQLEDLPSPWLTGTIPLQEQDFIRWETQRGCPFRCAFCQHREAGARLKRKDFSHTRIFREIKLFCQNQVKDIAVLDPIFNTGKHSTRILQAFVSEGYQGHLSLQCRAEMITPKFLDVVAALDVTLEFGLQTIHNNESSAINRKNNIKKVDDVLAEVRRRGIHHEVSLIFGLPEQTLDSFLASVSWCLVRQVPVLKAFPLMLLRGTPLEQQKHLWQLQEDNASMPVVKASSTFTEDDWQQMAVIAEALKATEGAHPSAIQELLTIASQHKIQQDRWRPFIKDEAA